MPEIKAIDRYVNSEYANMAKRRNELIEERRRTVYNLVPEIEEIDAQISSVGIRYSAKLIDGSIDAKELSASMEKELEDLKKKRNECLKKQGMTAKVFDVPYNCAKCKDTGYINGKRCACCKEKVKAFILDAAAQISNIPIDFEANGFRTADFSFYDSEVDPSLGVSPLANAKSIYRICHTYCKNFAKHYENLFIYGPAGVGKTRLTSCMAEELLNMGYCVMYQSSYRLFKFFEDCYFNRSTVKNAQILKDAIYDCDLLIIDDFGTEFVNLYTKSVLFDLLNVRISEKRPIIINSNFNISDLEPIYSERISSRMGGDFTLLRFVGKDIRQIKREAEEGKKKC